MGGPTFNRIQPTFNHSRMDKDQCQGNGPTNILYPKTHSGKLQCLGTLLHNNTNNTTKQTIQSNEADQCQAMHRQGAMKLYTTVPVKLSPLQGA